MLITKYTEYCLLCGKPKEDIHHLVFGNGNRKLADRYSLYIPICRSCHEAIHKDIAAQKLSKICGQLLFEKHDILMGAEEDDAREHFRKIFGRSYL